MYLHQRDNWWNFRYDSSAIMTSLAAVRARQGLLLGRMNSLGFSLQDEAVLTSMALEVIKSSEIEGAREIGEIVLSQRKCAKILDGARCCRTLQVFR